MNVVLLALLYIYFICSLFCILVFWVQLTFEGFRNEKQQDEYLKLADKLKDESVIFVVFLLLSSSMFIFVFWPFLGMVKVFRKSKESANNEG